MMCHHKDCLYKIYPSQPIPINNKILYNYGKIVNNYTQNIYNCCENCKNKKQDITYNIPNFINYKIIEDNELNELIYQSFTCTDYVYAKIIFYLGKNKYRYAKNKIWYEFKDNRWYANKIHSIRTYLLDTLFGCYQKVIDYYEKNNEDINKINFIINKKQYLTSISIDNNIFIEAGNYFLEHDSNFDKKIDKNPYLIGFNNGIYDLEIMEFRNSNFDDYVSLSVDYNYNDVNDDITQFLQELLPNDKLRHCILKLLGYCLYSEYKIQNLYVLTGYNINGKNLLIKLIIETFGNYCKFINFTKDIQYSNLVIEGKKLIILNYENINNIKIKKNIIEYDKIINNIINEYYREPIRSFNLIIISDRLLDINNDNVYLIELPIKTSINDEIETKKIKNSFMNELIKYYNIYKKEKLEEIKIKKDYNELFNEYVESYIIKTKNINDMVKWTDIKIHFKNWIYNKLDKQISSLLYKKDFETYFRETEHLVRSKNTKRKQFHGWNYFKFIYASDTNN